MGLGEESSHLFIVFSVRVYAFYIARSGSMEYHGGASVPN
jgi:hypothetical protein